jgi:hypothetical protein
MKKNLIFVLCLALTVSVFGFEAGTKSVGGHISLSSYKYNANYPSSTSLSIFPEFSYFVVDHLCVDLSPGFGVRWMKDEDTTLSLGIGIGARYFIKNFYGGGAFYYNKSGPKGFKSSAQELQLKIGHLVGIAKNIYLDLGVIYQHGLGKIKLPYPYSDSDNDTSTIKAQAGIAIFFK